MSPDSRRLSRLLLSQVRTRQLATGAAESGVVDGARSAASKCHRVVASKRTTLRGAVHMQITTIGLDIAKNVFQVHGIDAAEKVVVRKQLRRNQVLAFFYRRALSAWRPARRPIIGRVN
jgi:hypothetical protein